MLAFREFSFQQRLSWNFHLQSWKLAFDRDLEAEYVWQASKSQVHLTQISLDWGPATSKSFAGPIWGWDCAQTSGAMENLLLFGWICFIKPFPWQQGSTWKVLQLTLWKISPLSRYSKLHSMTHGGFLFRAICWIINVEQTEGIKEVPKLQRCLMRERARSWKRRWRICKMTGFGYEGVLGKWTNIPHLLLKFLLNIGV